MKIGTIGAGTIARAVARHAARHGHEVVLSNSRGPETLGDVVAEIGPPATAGTRLEAARAEVVLLAVHWTQVPAAVADLPDWDGRIVIDATNQFTSLPPHPVIADLGDLTGSEYIASLLPGARVVKAFNTLYGSYIAADPRHEAGRQLLFLAGDDADARATVRELAEEFGFASIDLGPLREGGRLMQLGGPLSGLHALKQD
ncbi:NADPH-dependent F420 reductase [Pseudonocardia spinosispora]|uniref:NADPH-dependent F420 reductase n=1 Tax=Pseudonocardia spinosispora TaxID=103441 RepID=UPI00040738D6|nr:NAD(P)-binding domain-containing protein [Pseudonocardia spinosispora]